MGRAQKVVLVVFDGLRPDMVTPELMPNLHAFATGGTWLREARSVFPSVTRVATSSIAAGAPPVRHGVVGNAFWMPERLKDRPVDTGKFGDILAATDNEPNLFHGAATFGDALAAAGKGRVRVVHTGSAGSAFLLNPRVKENGHWTFSVHGVDHTRTPEAVTEMVAKFGPLPEAQLPRFSTCAYAARVFTDGVIPADDWSVAAVWFPEPDTSFHYLGIAHPDTLAMMKAADGHFGDILSAVAARKDAGDIAVIAASDHGQITVNEEIDLFARLTAAGMPTSNAFSDDLVLLGVRGAQAELRLRQHDAALRDKVVAFLREQPEVGQIFTKARNEVEGEAPGTLSLGLVHAGHERTADILFTMRSDNRDDHYGLPGLGLYMGGVPLGGGMHGGLNKHELNTMLAFGGAAPKRGVDAAPAGIIDIAPTILGLLGVAAPASMMGRDLSAEGEADVIVTATAGHGGFAQEVVIAGGRYLQSGGRVQ